MIADFTAVNKAFSNCASGKFSFSTSNPVEVLLLDPKQNNGSSGYLLTDGYHRVIEAILKKERVVTCKVDTSGYNDYWAITKDPFPFSDEEWQGLERFASEELIQEISDELLDKRKEISEIRKFLSEAIRKELRNKR